MSYNTVLPVTWDDIDRDAERLAAQALVRRPWDGILAIARGGLIPAALVAHRLAIRRIDVIAIQTYDDRSLGSPDILQMPRIDGEGAGWLAVDDLVDTGVTMRMVRTIYPRITVGVLYTKPLGHSLADAFVRSVPQDTWIRFPWEHAGDACAASE
jgi:xanthine phosphoribosyltransferase